MTTATGTVQNSQQIEGTVLDQARVTGEVLVAIKGEKGDPGETGTGSVISIIDSILEIKGDYPIQFNDNEFYSYCYLNDGIGPCTFVLDEEFENISGVKKTYLIGGSGVHYI